MSAEASCEDVWFMPRRSRYAGQPVDASSRRSIKIRPSGDHDVLISPDASHVDVDYFFHEGSFWRAVIPLQGVASIRGQAFNFSKARMRNGKHGREVVFDKWGLPKRTIPILQHVQSRFTMQAGQPAELYPLGKDHSTVPTHRVYDFVYSLEAVGPLGVAFNLRDGLVGNLISAHRFMSTQEMVFERLVVQNQYVTESPALPLSDHQQRKLLTASLLRSHQAGMTEPYYLYRVCGTNNCTSSPLQILDQVVDYNLRQRIGSALYRLPLNPRLYLRIRGLDVDPSFRKLLRNEFEAYIEDPCTQARKREYVRRMGRSRRAARERASSDVNRTSQDDDPAA